MVYILTLSYKGSLNAVLTVTFFPKPMNTLEEIAAQVCKLTVTKALLNEFQWKVILCPWPL